MVVFKEWPSITKLAQGVETRYVGPAYCIQSTVARSLQAVVYGYAGDVSMLLDICLSNRA